MTFEKKKNSANLKLPTTQFNRKESVDLSNFWNITFLRERESGQNPAELW